MMVCSIPGGNYVYGITDKMWEPTDNKNRYERKAEPMNGNWKRKRNNKKSINISEMLTVGMI